MTTSTEELAARLQRLEDHEAIRRTWQDYIYVMDTDRWDQMKNLFTSDGVLEMVGLDPINALVGIEPGGPGSDGVYTGGESIVNDFFAPSHAEFTNPSRAAFNTGHLSTTLRIDLDGDEATTLAYFFEIVGEDSIVLVGSYEQRLRREPDRWRISYLRITITYSARVQVSDIGATSLATVLSRPRPF